MRWKASLVSTTLSGVCKGTGEFGLDITPRLDGEAGGEGSGRGRRGDDDRERGDPCGEVTSSGKGGEGGLLL